MEVTIENPEHIEDAPQSPPQASQPRAKKASTKKGMKKARRPTQEPPVHSVILCYRNCRKLRRLKKDTREKVGCLSV